MARTSFGDRRVRARHRDNRTPSRANPHHERAEAPGGGEGRLRRRLECEHAVDHRHDVSPHECIGDGDRADADVLQRDLPDHYRLSLRSRRRSITHVLDDALVWALVSISSSVPA